MKEYVTILLETHLFFGRIMKEHPLFLPAGFPAKGIICCETYSIIFTFLADYVLRGANHYMRILEYAQKGGY